MVAKPQSLMTKLILVILNIKDVCGLTWVLSVYQIGQRIIRPKFQPRNWHKAGTCAGNNFKLRKQNRWFYSSIGSLFFVSQTDFGHPSSEIDQSISWRLSFRLTLLISVEVPSYWDHISCHLWKKVSSNVTELFI